ncbi:MAG TPA: alpha/beta hydrolase [Alphaproteobacteria bacterium]
MSNREFTVNYVEAGSGPLVVLVHASMSGARQWSGLMETLQNRYRLRAINLFGYGRTPQWAAEQPPALDDYADLVLSALPPGAERVALVGHSFGGAVAMQAARRLDARAARLILIEPSLFSLLAAGGRSEAHAEIAAVADGMEQLAPEAAAEQFIGYWAGDAAWAATPPERKEAFVHAVGLVRHEFGAAFAGGTTLAQWREALPRRTLVVCAAETKRSSREVVELLALAGGGWEFALVPEGGHMSPLTHPKLVNPIVGGFLLRD